MKITVQKNMNQKFLLWCSLVLTFILETLITMGVLPDISIVKGIQYIITLFPLFLCGMHLYKDREFRRQEIYFGEELKTGILIMAVFAGCSLWQSIHARAFAKGVFLQLIQMLLPFIYAFLIINELTPKEIMSFMKITLFLTVIGYLFQIDYSQITLHNILTISMTSSYSPFENSSYAEIASGLAAYFIYNRKKEPVSFWISIILNFLIFKRVLVLMAVLLLFIEYFNWSNKKISFKWIKASVVFWLAAVFGYYYLIQPETAAAVYQNTGFSIDDFTMHRVYRLWYLIENNFASYGLGSTQEYLSAARYSWIGGEMEMDFVRFMVEVGPIAVLVFIYEYLKICKRNCYAYVMISMCFLNLLMANGILQYRGYVFRFITIAAINYAYQGEEAEGVTVREGKQ